MPAELTIDLTDPQFQFVTAAEQFPAMVAGFGAGKSFAGIHRALARKLSYPGQDVAYYLPTYDLVSKMGIPRFEEELDRIGQPFRTNKNDALIQLGNSGSIIFRTMDTPSRIVAYEVADSIVDELDVLPTDKARDVWNKVIARNRQKKPDGSLNTVGVATTPEGFRFVYERWKKNPGAGYRLIKASTMSNAANLPAGYIDSLRASYPANLLAAYLDGEFVNLTSGSVYAEFDRHLNASSETIQTSEPLHIGLDFNVGKMAAVVLVLRDGNPHAVDELTGILDTPAMIAAIKARFVGHSILVYPDASGNSRKSNNASESDIALLRAASFNVLVSPSNPAVKDRVLAVGQMICSGAVGVENTLGMEMRGGNPVRRRLRVNVDRCPMLVECLEKQAYDKNGEPDKSGDLDHLPDALGYFTHYRFPVRGRAMQRVTIGGF
jgi:hypothetical protein